MLEYIRVEVLFTRAINFAMQQNGVPIVRQVVIYNEGDVELRDIDLRIAASPEIAKPWMRKIDLIAPESSINISDIDMAPNPDKLVALTEKVVGTLHVELLTEDETLEAVTEDIEWLAYDQ